MCAIWRDPAFKENGLGAFWKGNFRSKSREVQVKAQALYQVEGEVQVKFQVKIMTSGKGPGIKSR